MLVIDAFAHAYQCTHIDSSIHPRIMVDDMVHPHTHTHTRAISKPAQLCLFFMKFWLNDIRLCALMRTMLASRREAPAASIGRIWAHNRMSLSNNHGRPHTLRVPPLNFIWQVTLVPAPAAPPFNSHQFHCDPINEATILYLLLAAAIASISPAFSIEHHFHRVNKST